MNTPVRRLTPGVLVLLVFASVDLRGSVINVPSDHSTIQAALDVATAGDTVEVETGLYVERVAFPISGTLASPITLRAKEGHSPVLDGTGLTVDGLSGLVLIEDVAYVRIEGFEIRNYVGTGPADFPAGIWVLGTSHHVEILDNVVHHIENPGCANCGAHGIAVYGTSADGSIHDLLIDGNTVRDCVLGWSESLVLNGNVEHFVVSNNQVHDNDNIGIDLIGFEGECAGCSDALDRVRDGVVAGNHVYRIDSGSNPAYAGERSADGIYVDGGTRILIERNVVEEANIGIEIASEHAGKATSEITVRNNFVSHSHTVGFAMGGYDTMRGSTEDCIIVNNTLFQNDTDDNGLGEMTLQFDTRNNLIRNNLLVAGPQNVFLTNAFTQNSGNVIETNLYFSAGGAVASEWSWLGVPYTGFEAWQAGTGNDATSAFDDPLLVAPGSGDLHLGSTSPAIDAGASLSAAETGSEDIDGDPRFCGLSIDIGADEFAVDCGIFADGFESGDLSAWSLL